MPRKLFVLSILFMFFAAAYSGAKTPVETNGGQIFIVKSRIRNKKIIITDNLGREIDYRIKGICYAPDTAGEIFCQTYTQDIPLIQAAGANSIKTYRPLGCYDEGGNFIYESSKELLDACLKAGITVSAGFCCEDMAEGGLMEQYLKMFGRHPALLMIVLGNEYNYHYGEWFTKEEWLSRLASAVKRARKYMPDRIIAVSHGEMPSKEEYGEYVKAGVDYIMMNMYRGSNFGFSKSHWDKISPAMPWGVSEFGRSSLDAAGRDTSKLQAAQLQTLIRCMENGYLFTLVDDPGKGAFEFSHVIGREDGMGIYDKDRNPKRAVCVVKEEYDKIPGECCLFGVR